MDYTEDIVRTCRRLQENRWKRPARNKMQITTICPEEMAEGWKSAFTQLMEKAGKYILPSGLLKAETTISPCWTK